MNKPLRRTWIWIIALGSASCWLAGCGDDDETQPPGTGGSAGSGAHQAGSGGDGGSGGGTGATGGSGGGVGGCTSGLYENCNGNGTCEWPETCNTCPGECHSCDVDSYEGQRARYIDQECEHYGDGLADECAASAGAAGRFNELQHALDQLQAGDTLYIHPGDYWQEHPDGYPGFRGVYDVPGSSSGSADQPVIITARFPDDPPVIHSFDPDGVSDFSRTAIATHGEEDVHHVIFDGLAINGMIGASNHHNTIQNIDCTHGWGHCDGNWACIRIEACTECLAHHNFVHDVEDTEDYCAGSGWEPRETGLKEFTATRTIWEYNTVRTTQRWGYDLHRNSESPTVRFNRFEDVPAAVIRVNRATDSRVYGNIVLGLGSGVQVLLHDEDQPLPQYSEVHHNTCAFTSIALSTNPQTVTTFQDNAVYGLPAGSNERGNVNAPGSGHSIDYNGWDSNSFYHVDLYDNGTQYDTLADWQAATGYDAHSQAGPGGVCSFADPPADMSDFDYDLRLTGDCATLASDGGEVGAYGLTSCVGHACASACE